MSNAESVAVEAARAQKTAANGRPGRLSLRVLLVGGLWTGLWWSIIGTITAPILPGRWYAIAAAAAAAFAPMVWLVRRFGSYPSAFVRIWILRPFLYLQIGAALTAIAGVAGTLIGLVFGNPVGVGRVSVLAAAASIAAAAVIGYIGSRSLRVRAFDARFADLPPDLDGLRIVQISDLHVGPHTPERHLANIERAVNGARPDLIAITGDHVDDARDTPLYAAAFAGLRAPLGIFAVPGNHDIYAGWTEVRAGLEAMGITVLVNDAVSIDRGNERLVVAGTGDPAGGGRLGGDDAAPHIGRTLARVPKGAFVVALAHNPALWPYLADRGVQLTLSGHTHHGQVSIPSLGWSVASLFLEHAMGWYTRAGARLYINPGTNYWGLPLRIGALPEVTVVTLRRSTPDEVATPSLKAS